MTTRLLVVCHSVSVCVCVCPLSVCFKVCLFPGSSEKVNSNAYNVYYDRRLVTVRPTVTVTVTVTVYLF